jgi:hypothetical protein
MSRRDCHRRGCLLVLLGQTPSPELVRDEPRLEERVQVIPADRPDASPRRWCAESSPRLRGRQADRVSWKVEPLAREHLKQGETPAPESAAVVVLALHSALAMDPWRATPERV